MTETTAEIVPDTVSLMVPVEVDGDALAVALAKSGNSYEQLVRLIQDIDSEVGDWSFTRRVLRHFVTVYLELAADDDDSELLDGLRHLLQLLPED